MQRRDFFKLVFGMCTGAIAAIVGIPVVAAFLDPTRRPTVIHGKGPKAFGRVSDLVVGTPCKLDVIDDSRDAWDRTQAQPIGAVWLVRRQEQKVDAYVVACPHLGCPTDFDTKARVFTCPCHDSAFDLADGRCLKGPSPRGLDPLPVDVQNGEVFVTYKRFVQGIPSRREA